MALNTSTSIVDYLKSTGQDSSFAGRQALAQGAGISGYSGSASQNQQLLQFLSGGGGSSPASASGGGGSNSNPYIQDGLELGSDGMPLYGASGRGEWNVQEGDLGEALDFGVPMSELGNFLSDPAYRIPTLSGSESAGLASEYGLLGIGDANRFAGLTRAQAQAKAQQEKDEALGKVSSKTSYAWNQDYMAPLTSSKKILDGLNLGLKDTQSPWNTEQDKTTGKNKLIENSTQEFAKLFQSPTQFEQYYNGDSEFRQIMEAFQKAGGNTDAVRNLINRGVNAVDTTMPRQNPQVPAMPTVKTDNEMLKNLADSTNMQIAEQYGIPEKYRELYFGDTGYFTQMRKDAEDQLSSLDARYADIKKNTLADYEANVARANAEADLQLANIEEQRQDSKTYMTGMLAKLGALKTTGQAGATMQRIEAKYNNAATSVRNALLTAKSTLASSYANNITTIENELADKMSAIRSDTRKSGFQAQLEMMKLEQEARDKVGTLISDFNGKSLDVDREALAEANKLNLEYQKNVWDTLRMRENASLNLRNEKEIASYKANLEMAQKQFEKGLELQATGGVSPDVIKASSLVNNLLDNPNLASISGTLDQFTGGRFGQSAVVKNQYDQLINTLTVIDRGKLKGQGAITDKETEMLQKSVSAIGRNLSDSAFKQELLNIRGILSLNSGLTVPVKVGKDNTVQNVNRDQYYKLVTEGNSVKFADFSASSTGGSSSSSSSAGGTSFQSSSGKSYQLPY